MPPVKKPPHARAKTFMFEWRKSKKLSQEKAAERANIDRTTLGRIERGELPYNQDVLEKLALAYGCDPEDLLALNPLEPRETEVVKLFRLASPEVRKIVETILKTGT